MMRMRAKQELEEEKKNIDKLVEQDRLYLEQEKLK